MQNTEFMFCAELFMQSETSIHSADIFIHGSELFMMLSYLNIVLEVCMVLSYLFRVLSNLCGMLSYAECESRRLLGIAWHWGNYVVVSEI